MNCRQRHADFEAAHLARIPTRSASEEMSYDERGISSETASVALRVGISTAFSRSLKQILVSAHIQNGRIRTTRAASFEDFLHLIEGRLDASGETGWHTAFRGGEDS
jgi:hypothetical protein